MFGNVVLFLMMNRCMNCCFYEKIRIVKMYQVSNLMVKVDSEDGGFCIAVQYHIKYEEF